MLTGKHLIAGEWVCTGATFASEPAHGSSHDISLGTGELVDTAVAEDEAAFATYGWSSGAERATFLRKIADEIDARGDAITEIDTQETSLPEVPQQGEPGRTVGQLRLFADRIQAGWAASLKMGAGPFCTNPGIATIIYGSQAEVFQATAESGLSSAANQTMRTDGNAAAYRDGDSRVATGTGVSKVMSTRCEAPDAAPYLFTVSGDDWLADQKLQEKGFGPLGIIVRAIDGNPTCTIHLGAGDKPDARALPPRPERKAGRLLTNGFPKGVDVCDSMVHGGPYPASTNVGATSLGTLSIRRFLCPACYQDIPTELLPEKPRGRK